MTIQHDGKMVDVVVQAGKNGFVYVFDRANGKPIWPIEERPVPKSDVPGEEELADAAVPDAHSSVCAAEVYGRYGESLHRRP